METNYREKLAHLVIILITLSIVGAACWYLRSVLTYIVLALVITVLSLPFCRLFAKIRIRRFAMPDWLAAILSIMTVFAIVGGLITLLAPLMRDVTNDISRVNLSDVTKVVSVPLASINEWARDVIPNAGPGFKIENVILGEIQKVVNVGMVGNFVGSVTSFVANMGVTLFAVVFIAFFLLKSPSLLSNVLVSMVPDEMEEKIRKSLQEISVLIARYFIGVSIEVAGVWLINFIGLWAIAQMGFKYSLSIAFLAGLLNIIPYIGPLIGGVLGVSLSLMIHYAGMGVYGLDVPLIPFVLILVGIFVFAQMVDNYLFQPVIYSSSVKAHPLEIFLVFLVAGKLGGMLGMLAAVPAYTVFRVVAKEFFGHIKPIRRLTCEDDDVPAQAAATPQNPENPEA